MAGLRVLLPLLLLMAALPVVPPASAGEPEIRVRVAKQEDGPYRAAIRANVAPGETKSLWWRVTNRGVAEQALTFTDDDSSNATGFHVKWFRHGANVSSEVKGAGYPFNIDPGQRKFFNAKVKATDPGEDFCLEGEAVYMTATVAGAYAGINDRCVA